jgi:hypothetical protein
MIIAMPVSSGADRSESFGTYSIASQANGESEANRQRFEGGRDAAAGSESRLCSSMFVRDLHLALMDHSET